MHGVASALPIQFAILIVTLLIVALAMTMKFCVDDAQRRGKSPVWVTIAAVFFFPWGLIAWLLFRPDLLDGGGKPEFRLDNHRQQ
jgi:uncharacterized protein (DUF983 family)